VSLLQIVQDAMVEVGLSSPTSATGSFDPIVLQMVQIANREGRSLAARHSWTALVAEGSFATVATEIQTSVNTAAPGYERVLNDTMWNRDLRRPVFGPLQVQRWEQLKAMVLAGPWNQFKIEQGNILFIPVPTAGQHIYFAYVSKNWVTVGSGPTSGQTSDRWVTDADTSLLDENLITLGLIWRWKKAKGFAYAEDFQEYERQVMDKIGRDGSRDVLQMGDMKTDIYPGITVPAGNWTGH
jgi:hypothetical protein